MQHFRPLNQQELDVLSQVANLIQADTAIGCTNCQYCLSECPKQIAIPQYFALYNDDKRNHVNYVPVSYTHLEMIEIFENEVSQ